MTITKNGLIAIIGTTVGIVGIVVAYFLGWTQTGIVALAVAAVGLGATIASFWNANTKATWKKLVATILIVIGFGAAGFSTIIDSTVATKLVGYVIAIITVILAVIAGTYTSSSSN